MSIPIHHIKTDQQTVNHIYHVSDIHIRLRQRHDEYNQVFKNLYKLLKKMNKKKDGIIVLTGDILHSKTHLSPEAIELTTSLFRNLSAIMPTIIIAGNHDANLSNLTRLDALSPIIEPIQNINGHELHYLRYSGIYHFLQIRFGVTSVFGLKDNENQTFKTIIKASDIENEENTLKIALCHETVNNSKVDNGYSLSNNVTTKDFIGYDMTLLGDIHKRQFLNKKKTIAYAGSLIQQDKGESIDKHGIIRWDLNEKSGKFYNVLNDCGFYKLEYKQGKFLYNDEDPNGDKIHDSVRLFIEHDKSITEPDLRKKIRKLLQKQGKEVKSIFAVQVEDDINNIDNLSNESYDFNISDVKKQNYYIDLFMKSGNNKYSAMEIAEIQDFNTELNKMLKVTESINMDNWEIETLEFSNLFSYGENNKVNFSKMKGIYGFIAPNHTGKSSIIDIILYLLYDNCSRCSTASVVANEILNNTKTKFDASIIFKILDKRYCIRKVGIKGVVKKDSVKVSVYFWELLEDGKKLDLKGTQRSDTKKIIEKFVGRYEDFLLTSVSLQNNLKHEFIELTTGNRVDRLNSLLRIDLFEDLRKMVVKKNDDIKVLLKYDNDNSDEISEIKSNNKKIIEKLEGLSGSKEKKMKDLENLQVEIDELNISTKEIKDELIDIKELENRHTELIKQNKDMKEYIKQIQEWSFSDEEQKKIETDYSDFNSNNTKEINEINTRISSLRSQIKNLEIPKKIKEHSKFSNTLDELNELIYKKEKKLEIKNNNLQLFTKKLETAEEKYQKLKDYNEEEFLIIEENHAKYVDNNYKIKTLQSTIDMKSKKLEQLKEHKYDPKCNFCINNVFVKDAINTKKEMDNDLKKMNKLKEFKFDVEKYEEYKSKLKEKKLEDKKITSEKDNILSKTLELNDYKETILKLNEILEYKTREIELSDNNEKINKKIQELTESKKNISQKIFEPYEKLKIYLKGKETIQNRKLQLKNNKYELDKIKVQIQEIEKNKSILKKNLENKEKIKELKIQLKHLNQQIKEIDQEINQSNVKKALNDQKIGEHNEHQKKFAEFKKKHDLYEKYIKIMQKNGLPYFLISKIIPTLEQRINSILRKIVDFTIRFDLEHKKQQKYINLYIKRGDQEYSINLTSGFEKFLTNIILKIGIRSISKIPKSNFIILDEGFGNFDEEHLNSTVKQLFQFLRMNFDYVIVISHIDTLKDQIDNAININRDDVYSNINWT